MMQEYTDKQKAIDYANWLNFIHNDMSFYVIKHDNDSYLVCSKESETDNSYHIPLETKYAEMDYKDIQAIRTDTEPLQHWENLSGLISTMDGALLRFILKHNIPLEKFIRYELGARGYDQNGKWIGFDDSEKFWWK